MSPYRLNADQRLLYDALADIWRAQSRKVVLSTMASLAVAVGLVVGTLVGTRATVRQTGVIALGLHRQVEQNRVLIDQVARDRVQESERYQNLLAAFESVKRRAGREHPERRGGRRVKGP